MEHRGVEYGIVQGVGKHMWKWTAWVGGAVVSGQAHTKQAAVVSAEKAINRSLAIKKVRLDRQSDRRRADPAACGLTPSCSGTGP